MKLKPTLYKLSLFALLSMGLACVPLAASADQGNHGWRGHDQHNRGKSGHRTEQYSVYRDYDHHVSHDSCRMDHRHGFNKGYVTYRPYGHDRHFANIQRRYSDGQHEHHPFYFLGIFSGNQDSYFLD